MSGLLGLAIMSKPVSLHMAPLQRTFFREGGPIEGSLARAASDPGRDRVQTIADEVPVARIMSRAVTCARPDLEMSRLVELMVQSRIGCVPVIGDRGCPIGMVTKLDLVERLAALQRDDATTTRPAPGVASDVMMPFAITLAAHATVAHAAAIMAREDVHHVPIVDDDGRVVGIVSASDIVRWLATNDGFDACTP